MSIPSPPTEQWSLLSRRRHQLRQLFMRRRQYQLRQGLRACGPRNPRGKQNRGKTLRKAMKTNFFTWFLPVSEIRSCFVVFFAALAICRCLWRWVYGVSSSISGKRLQAPRRRVGFLSSEREPPEATLEKRRWPAPLRKKRLLSGRKQCPPNLFGMKKLQRSLHRNSKITIKSLWKPITRCQNR